MIRLKNVWLVPIVLIFVISAIISISQLRNSLAILEVRQGTSVWSLFMLRAELQRFYDTLEIYSLDQGYYSQVQKRYDILWSRYPVLIEGRDARHLDSIPGAHELLKSSFEELRQMEPIISSQLLQNPGLTAQLQRQLKPQLKAFAELSHENFHLNSTIYNRADGRVEKIQQQLMISVFGLIITGALLLWMMLRESQRNRYQAMHDNLTDMPNRAALKSHIASNIENEAPFALHLIDLNGFKDVNDTLGHHVGDQLLQEVSNRLASHIDNVYDATTYRLGGDEFAIVQDLGSPLANADHLATLTLHLFDKQFTVEEHAWHIGASIGTSLHPRHGKATSQLLTQADIAMYKAKEQAPLSTHITFSFEMDAEINRRQQLQKDLRIAIEKNKLHLVYQPILCLEAGEVAYMEALLRWIHPLYGPIPPLEIIQVAEQYAQATTLGCWIIDETCRQIKTWQDCGFKPLPVSVNISPSMHHLDLADIINNSLERHGLEKGLIWIEVTEDTTMQILKETQGLLPELNLHGVKVALDDFGTGLSSLSHLQRLPIQTLKIDRSFIQQIAVDSTSSRLVRNIIGIGHDLGMKVVAEGIETPKDAELLTGFHCDYGQGYLFSKPLSPEEIPDFCRQHSLPYAEPTLLNHNDRYEN